MLQHFYASRKTINFLPPTSGFYLGCWWAPSWDSLVMRTGPYDFYKIFRDGTAVQITFWPGSLPVFGPLADGLYAWAQRPGESGSWALPVDPVTLQADATYVAPLLPYRLDQIPNLIGKPYIDLRRNIYAALRDTNPKSLCVYDAGTQALLRTIPVTLQRDQAKLCYVNDSRLAVFVEAPTKSVDVSQVTILDWQSGEIVLDSVIEPYCYAEFDPKHQVVLSLGRDAKAHVWGLKPVPANLSNPEFVAAGPVYSLQPRKVKVRLTGSVGEACAGWWIHWHLLNGLGALRWEVSRTDAQGYAYNYYAAPPGTGPEEIHCWVQT